MIETLELRAYEPTKSGKGYSVTTNADKLYVFEPDVSQQVIGAIGAVVNIDVDRSPNKQGKVFPTIRSFHGPADGSASPAPAAVPAAQPGNAAAQAPVGAPPTSTRNGGYTKDPISQLAIARQVALKCAVDLAPLGVVADPEVDLGDSVIALAEKFDRWLGRGGVRELLVDEAGLDRAAADDGIPF